MAGGGEGSLELVLGFLEDALQPVDLRLPEALVAAVERLQRLRQKRLRLCRPAAVDEDLGDPGQEHRSVQLLLVDLADRREPVERLPDLLVRLVRRRGQGRSGQAEEEAAVRLEEVEPLLLAMVVEALGIAVRRGLLAPEVVEERQEQKIGRASCR